MLVNQVGYRDMFLTLWCVMAATLRKIVGNDATIFVWYPCLAYRSSLSSRRQHHLYLYLVLRHLLQQSLQAAAGVAVGIFYFVGRHPNDERNAVGWRAATGPNGAEADTAETVGMATGHPVRAIRSHCAEEEPAEITEPPTSTREGSVAREDDGNPSWELKPTQATVPLSSSVHSWMLTNM